MIKINDHFEMDYDGCWNLYQWKPGFKMVDGKRVPEMKRTGPSYYSALPHLCSAVIDRSAGRACAGSENIIDAIHQAEKDIMDTIGARDFRYAWE